MPTYSSTHKMFPSPGGGIRLISEAITELLSVPVSVLMGANLAGEVADGHFCETTIGAHDAKGSGTILKKMFQVRHLRGS